MGKARKRVIIIGAGLAGLSTGCYAQMNGYDSTIFEMHSLPGGCCTSWKRKDYIFDWCLCWMLGTGPNNEMNRMWMELGALQGKKIVDFDIFNTVIGENGEKVHFYVDPDRLEEHLKSISSEDTPLIKRFCKDLRTFRKVVNAYPFLKPVGLMSIWERTKMYAGFLPYLRRVMKSHNLLMEDFSEQFQHPFLRKAINYIFFDKHPTFPLLPYYFNMAAAANRNAGCPEGGSIGLAESIEDRYISLAGKIHYKAMVKKILVENNTAIGIQLQDGTSHYADIIINASDIYSTVENMLEGRYKDETIDRLLGKLIHAPRQIYKGWVTVFLGVDMDLRHTYHSASYLLTEEETNQLPGSMHGNISVMIRNQHFPGICPEGKSVIFASYFSDANYWEKLNENAPKVAFKGQNYVERERALAYEQAKERAGDFMLSYLSKRFQGLKEKVEHVDISTPLTLERYTGNFQGSVLAWDPFNEAGELMEKYVEKNGPVLPGLKNFYMAGHWVSTGGVIRAISTGRHTMQFVCRDDGKKFQTSIPKDAAPMRLDVRRWTLRHKVKN
jgi:phytoene dehydrogenase-like protein